MTLDGTARTLTWNELLAAIDAHLDALETTGAAGIDIHEHADDLYDRVLIYRGAAWLRDLADDRSRCSDSTPVERVS